MRTGFTTLVVASSRAEQLTQFYCELGWQHETKSISDDERDYWHASRAADHADVLIAPNADCEVLILNVTDDTPLLRPLDAPLISPGGIFDINMRTHSTEFAVDYLKSHHWRLLMPPVPWQFGANSVLEFLAIQDDGIVLAVMERVTPPLEGIKFDRMSEIFNSTQIVEDIERSTAFYEEIGFRKFVDFRGNLPGEGARVLDLQDFSAEESRLCLTISHPAQKMEGSIELISVPNIQRRSLTKRAFGRGLVALRIPTANAQALYDKVTNSSLDIPIAATLKERTIAGRTQRCFAVLSPDGARLDLFER
jgi:catechol 2,3-dioxygenase-like lactoylglutathione lyase family enzyme